MDEATDNVLNLIASRPDGIGYTLQCHIVYPAEMQDDNSDLPFLPEMKAPTVEMLSEAQQDLYVETYGGKKFKSSKKLIPNLESKKKYITHYVNLQQAIENGVKVEKVHRVIRYRQKAWVKPYIEYKIEKKRLLASLLWIFTSP